MTEDERSAGGAPRRVLTRLKHPLPEGTEIHAVLPDSMEEIEREMARLAGERRRFESEPKEVA